MDSGTLEVILESRASRLSYEEGHFLASFTRISNFANSEGARYFHRYKARSGEPNHVFDRKSCPMHSSELTEFVDPKM